MVQKTILMSVQVLPMINNFTFPQKLKHVNNQVDGIFQRLWWFQNGA